MAQYFSTEGVNLTSFGGSRLNKNKTAVNLSETNVRLVTEGASSESYSYSFYKPPVTQLELGKDASGNYLNGTIKSFYYFPESLTEEQIKSLSLRRETRPTPTTTPSFTMMINILSSNFTWNLRSTGTVSYDVDWGDGQKEIIQTSNTKAHVYVNPGIYKVVVTIRSGVFRPFFNNATDANRIVAILGAGTGWSFGTNLATSFYGGSSVVNMENIDVSNVTDMSNAWRGFSSLLSFPFLDTPSVTNVAQAWTGCSSLTSFPSLNLAAVTNFSFAWQNCSSLTSFPLINTAAGTNFQQTWNGCSSLTSFPLINTAAGTNFAASWSGCGNLTSFPLINTAIGTTFSNAWQSCSSLTSFPLINTAAGTNFKQTWASCSSLTSFPSLNFDAAVGVASGSTFLGFRGAWQSCTSLANFPANLFNNTTCTHYLEAFQNCALTSQSIENIIVSINTANTSNGNLSLQGGTNATKTTWTTAANTAYDALIARGWTITFRP
jgi:hypothetical protein